jgi:DNA-binding SARP family transcriptional activator
MPSPKKVVVRKPDESGIWYAALANNQYGPISTCIESAYSQAVSDDDTTRVALLLAARQLCASCIQAQQEIIFHQEALQDSELRRDKLDVELEKLLSMLQLAPDITSPTPLTFWQRVRRFWFKEPPIEEEGPTAQEITPKIEKVNDPTPQVIESIPNSSLGSEERPERAPQMRVNSASPQLTVYCLGTFRIYEDDQPIDEWPSRKGKCIFKYLLLHREQRTTKDVLMAQFWPEATADAARNNLNVAIYGLRQALRNGYPDFSHVLFQDDCYFLNPEMEVWLDVEQFELIYHKLSIGFDSAVTAVSIPDLHAAELLYQGELLSEDPYEDWLLGPRQELQRRYLQVLSRLCKYYFDSERYAACIPYANKLLGVEPCHEATHRLLMRAFIRQQQRHLALRQYHHCVELLDDELAVSPDSTTTQLYEAIRNHEII